MNTKDTLIQARTLIEKRENWTQYKMARDKNGNGIEWQNPKAYSFCALGAIYKAAGGKEREVIRARKKLEVTKNKGGLWIYGFTHFNDHNSHAEVLNVFAEALKPRKRAKPVKSIE